MRCLMRHVVLFFTLACPVVVVGGEVLRSVMHRRRAKRGDFAPSTQDIAIIQTIALAFCLLGAIISGLIWAIRDRW
jgi:hypothetical protein